jgi:hypothetical protein
MTTTERQTSVVAALLLRLLDRDGERANNGNDIADGANLSVCIAIPNEVSPAPPNNRFQSDGRPVPILRVSSSYYAISIYQTYLLHGRG